MFEECFKTLSSLEKVVIDQMPVANEISHASILKNQRYSFQIAYTARDIPGRRTFKFEIKSELAPYITVRSVGHVPSEMPTYRELYDDYLINGGKPGLYPDPLFPMAEQKVATMYGAFDSLWFTVDTKGEVEAGTYDIEVVFTNKEESCTKKMTIEIVDAYLPEQKLMFTQWFHGDCIASHYNVPMFSEEHWAWLEKFVATATKNGINMLLTPIFTPPLDTKVGGERPTIQLVDIFLNNGEYSFNFDKLGRWFDMCLKCGVKYFEMAHLFTQWGALYCPKIMATVDGEYKRIFGWDTSSTSDEYREFLSKFLPALTGYIEERGLKDVTIFHISDEPHEENIEAYTAAKEGAAKYLEGYMIMDALSQVKFFNSGLVKHPMASLHYFTDFIEAGVKPRFTYYCCGHRDKFSNRFFAFPSWRTAMLGVQMYKYSIDGFLQWGYNFYYSQFSIRKIDPYYTTDAGRAFPSGDAFSVYPGENECIESIRLVVFHDGIQDMRALDLLESYIGKEAVDKLIDEVAGMEVTFKEYPTGSYFLEALRRRVVEEIKKHI